MYLITHSSRLCPLFLTDLTLKSYSQGACSAETCSVCLTWSPKSSETHAVNLELGTPPRAVKITHSHNFAWKGLTLGARANLRWTADPTFWARSSARGAGSLPAGRGRHGVCRAGSLIQGSCGWWNAEPAPISKARISSHSVCRDRQKTNL